MIDRLKHLHSWHEKLIEQGYKHYSSEMPSITTKMHKDVMEINIDDVMAIIRYVNPECNNNKKYIITEIWYKSDYYPRS